MKKMTVLRTILSVTLAAFLLCGCGNSTDATATSEDVPEVVEPVEAPDTEEKEEVTKPAEEEEETKQEEVVEEPTEETTTEMPEAQVTTTVENFDGLVAYVQSLDPNTPHIVIYNEAEGYIIDMKEGEYYQLKKDDRIFLNVNSDYMKNAAYSIPEISYQPIAGGWEIIPDYSKFETGESHYYDIYLSDNLDEYIEISCYLDPPAE